MRENTEARALFQDALSGKIDRRTVLKRAAALGVSAPVAFALAQASVGGGLRALAAEEGKPTATIQQWQFNLHPRLNDFGKEQGVNVEVSPSTNFGNERFIAEHKEGKSTWDAYGGVTPFLEMLSLQTTGTIEPWDQYLPAGTLEDFLPATREEGSIDGKLYVIPLLLDVCVQALNAEVVTKAGLDPETSPKNWDEFIANAQKVQDSKAAPYGLTFDNRDWRSLIPVTHSISTDVYTPLGLFRYASDATVQALEILKRMMPLTSSDVLAPGDPSGTVLPDQSVWAAQQAGYYFKYQNAPLTYSQSWPDPTQLRMDALPVQEGGAGGTVFWDTGAVLFTDGANKQKMADFMMAISKDEALWKESLVGNADEGIPAVGQIPVLQSLWAAWDANPPDWLSGAAYAKKFFDGMSKASAIKPTPLSVLQFDTARPEWHKYLSGETADAKTALQKAQDAVAAVYKKQTGQDADY